VSDLVRQQEHSDDLSSDTIPFQISLGRVAIVYSNEIKACKIAINAGSLFGHATHSAAVRSFPYAFGISSA
jgi:hypothetical protein